MLNSIPESLGLKQVRASKAQIDSKKRNSFKTKHQAKKVKRIFTLT